MAAVLIIWQKSVVRYIEESFTIGSHYVCSINQVFVAPVRWSELVFGNAHDFLGNDLVGGLLVTEPGVRIHDFAHPDL